MEGYLIRLPSCAWNIEDDSAAMTARSRRSRRSCKPQARLLYYILGEGYLEGFASPDDIEPVESFQLTSFEVEVDPVYSMLMFKVSTYEKKAVPLLSPPSGHGHAMSDISDDENENRSKDAPGSFSSPSGSTLLLFAGNRTLVELWCKKLVNWNRYVFAGAPNSADESISVDAKKELISAFHEKNNHGMFSVLCQLQDCTTLTPSDGAGPTAVDLVDLAATVTVQQFRPPPLPLPVPVTSNPKVEEDTAKPATRGDIKPLWMLLHRGSSRRIRSVPMSK